MALCSSLLSFGYISRNLVKWGHFSSVLIIVDRLMATYVFSNIFRGCIRLSMYCLCRLSMYPLKAEFEDLFGSSVIHCSWWYPYSFSKTILQETTQWDEPVRFHASKQYHLCILRKSWHWSCVTKIMAKIESSEGKRRKYRKEMCIVHHALLPTTASSTIHRDSLLLYGLEIIGILKPK